MKLTLRHVLILLAILILSVGFGFAYDAVADSIERRQHPQPEQYAAMISECAAEFGVPEPVIWAVVKEQSNFVSNAVRQDAVGLFQLTPALLEKICTEILHTEVPDAGMLHDPRTNLRLGSAYLSSLYRKYGMWEPVFAALAAGEGSATLWLADPECLNEQGRLTYIPDKNASAFVTRVQRSVAMYTKLYYEQSAAV